MNALKCLLVSIDLFTGCPEAKYLRKPNTEKVLEFLQKYITKHGIPKTIRTDPQQFLEAQNPMNFAENGT